MRTTCCWCRMHRAQRRQGERVNVLCPERVVTHVTRYACCLCRYAWSEGGDSLLDSEEEDCEEEVEECLKVPPPVYQESTPSEKCSASPPQASLLPASYEELCALQGLPHPSLLQQSASDRPPQSQSESHHSSGRSRVIRLDGQKSKAVLLGVYIHVSRELFPCLRVPLCV